MYIYTPKANHLFFSGHFIALNLVGPGAKVHHFFKSQSQGQRLSSFIVMFNLSCDIFTVFWFVNSGLYISS